MRITALISPREFECPHCCHRSAFSRALQILGIPSFKLFHHLITNFSWCSTVTPTSSIRLCTLPVENWFSYTYTLILYLQGILAWMDIVHLNTASIPPIRQIEDQTVISLHTKYIFSIIYPRSGSEKPHDSSL